MSLKREFINVKAWNLTQIRNCVLFYRKLDINIDMTLAMKCASIGADVLDMTGQNADKFGKLEMTPVPFELTPSQQQYFNMVHNMNSYVREEYHAIHKLLWKTGYISVGGNMPKRSVTQPTVNQTWNMKTDIKRNMKQ